MPPISLSLQTSPPSYQVTPLAVPPQGDFPPGLEPPNEMFALGEWLHSQFTALSKKATQTYERSYLAASTALQPYFPHTPPLAFQTRAIKREYLQKGFLTFPRDKDLTKQQRKEFEQAKKAFKKNLSISLDQLAESDPGEIDKIYRNFSGKRTTGISVYLPGFSDKAYIKDNLEGTLGTFHFGTHKITLSPRNEGRDTLQVLLHEINHSEYHAKQGISLPAELASCHSELEATAQRAAQVLANKEKSDQQLSALAKYFFKTPLRYSSTCPTTCHNTTENIEFEGVQLQYSVRPGESGKTSTYTPSRILIRHEDHTEVVYNLSDEQIGLMVFILNTQKAESLSSIQALEIYKGISPASLMDEYRSYLQETVTTGVQKEFPSCKKGLQGDAANRYLAMIEEGQFEEAEKLLEEFKNVLSKEAYAYAGTILNDAVQSTLHNARSTRLHTGHTIGKHGHEL